MASKRVYNKRGGMPTKAKRHRVNNQAKRRYLIIRYNMRRCDIKAIAARDRNRWQRHQRRISARRATQSGGIGGRGISISAAASCDIARRRAGVGKYSKSMAAGMACAGKRAHRKGNNQRRRRQGKYGIMAAHNKRMA